MRKIERGLKDNFENDLQTKVSAWCFDMDYYNIFFDTVLLDCQGSVSGIILNC